MNIGKAAKASGVSAKMIRHYEAIGLIPKATRSTSGYRNYLPADVHLLRFANRARAVGFSTGEIRQLLALWHDKQRPAREVRRVALDHVAQLESRIAQLRVIAATLSHLIDHCHGGDRPECPILDALADGQIGEPGAGSKSPKPPRRGEPGKPVSSAPAGKRR
jgi:Cu(I)-responsive transcriptional regulator